MSDRMQQRDELAETLAERRWDVTDTFGGLRESPALAVRVPDLTIDGETFAHAEVTVTVKDHGLAADRVEITDDEIDLSDRQRELLGDVSAERLPGPELTLWEYEPGSRDDDVEDHLEEIREVYEDAVA